MMMTTFGKNGENNHQVRKTREKKKVVGWSCRRTDFIITHYDIHIITMTDDGKKEETVS